MARGAIPSLPDRQAVLRLGWHRKAATSNGSNRSRTRPATSRRKRELHDRHHPHRRGYRPHRAPKSGWPPALSRPDRRRHGDGEVATQDAWAAPTSRTASPPAAPTTRTKLRTGTGPNLAHRHRPTTTCCRRISPSSASRISSRRRRARSAARPRSPAACRPCATASPRARRAWSFRCSRAT